MLDLVSCSACLKHPHGIIRFFYLLQDTVVLVVVVQFYSVSEGHRESEDHVSPIFELLVKDILGLLDVFPVPLKNLFGFLVFSEIVVCDFEELQDKILHLYFVIHLEKRINESSLLQNINDRQIGCVTADLLLFLRKLKYFLNLLAL